MLHQVVIQIDLTDPYDDKAIKLSASVKELGGSVYSVTPVNPKPQQSMIAASQQGQVLTSRTFQDTKTTPVPALTGRS